jgi:TolB-like protein/lipoprotein NlpI
MGSEPGERGGFFQELRRRNVAKVATVYLIASWVLIQVAETTFPALQLPEWTITFVVVILGILFPIAIIFAWAFEVTPEGLKKTAEVEADESITSQTGQKINYLIIGGLVIAVLVLVATHGRIGGDAGPDREADAAAKSIAVLPFVNMSDDKDNEFFSDGLSEELLNVLAQVDGLRVAARTSSFHFKGKNEDLRTVADKLGVEHLLEGSVRKSGNRIRVTAQLIKADDGFHLWSDTYDYEVDDVFRIQDEISLAVVDALKVSLLGQERERITRRATTSVEAHSLYLRGRQFLHLRTLEAIQQAKTLFENAVREDTGYALAYSGLSDAYQLLSNNHNMMPADQAVEKSRPLIERALALDPDSAEVWASVGLVELHAKHYDEAEAALTKAMALNPSYAPGYLWYASLLGQMPDSDEQQAIEVYRKVLTIDPLSRVAQNNIASGLISLGRYEEAEKEFLRAIALDPDYDNSYQGLGNLYSNVYHRMDTAHEWFLKAHDLAPLDASVAVNLPGIYSTLGMDEEYERWLRRIANDAPDHPFASLMPGWRAAVRGDQETLTREIRRLQPKFGDLPVLPAFECLRQAMAGTSRNPLINLRDESPELFAETPRVRDDNAGNVACAARILREEKDGERLSKLLAAAANYADSEILERANREIYLAQVEVAAGNDEDAVRRLAAALDQGWVGGFGFGLRIERDPYWRHLLGRDDVKALIAELDSRLERQRVAVEQQLAERGIGEKF